MARSVQHGEHLLAIIEHGSLGDLQLKPVRRKSAVAQGGAHAVDEALPTKLLRRNVHRDGGITTSRHCTLS
jgi:hypothetical protein